MDATHTSSQDEQSQSTMEQNPSYSHVSHHETGGESSSESLFALLKTMQQRFADNPYPKIEERKQKLEQLKSSLINHKSELVQALSDDFGYRSAFDSTMADVMPTVTHINYTLKHLKKWLKPSRRHAGLVFAPSKVSVRYQPLGVVGIISPWNFPVILSIAPLVTALAAGNKVMMKLSEFTPKTNQVIRRIVEVISQDVAVVEGESEVAQAFSRLRFDHLLFTGSTVIGRAVAQEAAKNLTPVTLELGGKSPVIVAEDASLTKTVDAIIFGKSLNAGQICVSPDYAFIPQDRVNEFIELFLARFDKLYPAGKKGRVFTHIINSRQRERLMSYLEDAKTQGATLHTVTSQSLPDKQSEPSNDLLPYLVTDVSDDMLLMQQEIFGPILPIKPYQNLREVIDYVNQGERPLALYLMTESKEVIEQVLHQTHSGGVAINDTVLHVAAEDAPFGGIGESGIGHYHGIEGFKVFSHAKTVFHTPAWLPRLTFLMKHKKLAVRLFNRWFIR